MKYELRTQGGATTFHEFASDVEALRMLDYPVNRGSVITRLVTMHDGTEQRWQVRTPRRLMPPGHSHDHEHGLRGGAVGWTSDLDMKGSAA